MFYTVSSRLLVPPNTIFVTDHTTGYFVNVLPDWLIVILSLECYIVICIDWLYVDFTALCFSQVEVRFDISVIKELIDWLISSRIRFLRFFLKIQKTRLFTFFTRLSYILSFWVHVNISYRIVSYRMSPVPTLYVLVETLNPAQSINLSTVRPYLLY